MSKTDTVFVAGRGREKAIALLAIAGELGYEPGVVRTTLNGYNVPADVAKKFDASVEYEPAPEKPIAPAVVVLPDAPLPEETEAEEDADDEIPAKNASLEAWIAYAETKGYDTARGLTRNDLIDEYGQN